MFNLVSYCIMLLLLTKVNDVNVLFKQAGRQAGRNEGRKEGREGGREGRNKERCTKHIIIMAYGVRHMIKDDSDNKRRNPLLQHH